MAEHKNVFPMPDGTVYSPRKGFRPFSVPSLEAYANIVGVERLERLKRAARRVEGLKVLQLNATAVGGGVAEMLYSAIPFANQLGVEDEWKIIRGSPEFFECTKRVHNLLQGLAGSLTPEMVQTYSTTIAECVDYCHLLDYHPDVVLVHDPQPAGLSQHLKQPGQTWVWRCHIDIEEDTLQKKPYLRDFMQDWLEHYDAAVFSAAHYVITHWRLPKFIIPPFIDPLSEKNRDLSQEEIDCILDKYEIDPSLPSIVQIGRFDPWKGFDRTIATYRLVRERRKCQLVLAGGIAGDDPEGERVLSKICEETKRDNDVHVLNIPVTDRLQSCREVNALQRAANIIMQPSTKEGFGLVITEALWKGKPVVTSDVGAIPLQVREGETGYFYQSVEETAEFIVNLMDHPDVGKSMGQKGKQYVGEHFLMPDRIADWFMALDMLVNGHLPGEGHGECIISFHPWFKLHKRP
jgi:trehalose synthase